MLGLKPLYMLVCATRSQQTKAAYSFFIVNTIIFAVAALVCQMSPLAAGAQRSSTT